MQFYSINLSHFHLPPPRPLLLAFSLVIQLEGMWKGTALYLQGGGAMPHTKSGMPLLPPPRQPDREPHTLAWGVCLLAGIPSWIGGGRAADRCAHHRAQREFATGIGGDGGGGRGQ